jgi:hypothetical protein
MAYAIMKLVLAMKAVEFETTVNRNGVIMLPPEMAADVPSDEPVRVVLMWDASSPDSAWRDAGRQQFEQAYCAADDVYEQLADDDAPKG